ncbi:uncharacterized protein LOC131678343 [Topomyia yanbarensis]|uniref:uncharacterized protein LOC131678343 n=1 Tax=Topomyia yanbarensis TaxID=2498891 RepID=UPI00273CCB84|nr:uncharacterized protein LOC131678343 [Topomyia yanbarensis]
MNSWKRIKTSGTFKRKVKKNFYKILNINPLLFQKVQQPARSTIYPKPETSSSIESAGSRETDGGYELDQNRKLHLLDVSERWEPPAHEEEYVDPDPADETFANLRLLDNLHCWAVKNNIRHSVFKELLAILNIRLSNILPRDPRTLLKTIQSVDLQQMENGQYWHQGVKNCLERVLSESTGPSNISLKVNIDGVPVYRSSKDEFWPILINIDEYPQVAPMIVGIYAGKQKPTNVGTFLSPFVAEMEKIYQEGIYINGHKVTVSIRCFVCDSLARAFIKGLHTQTYFEVLQVMNSICDFRDRLL